MKIATAATVMSKRWKTQDYTWSEIVDRLKKVQYTDETFAEYKRMSKDEKLIKKNAAGAYFGGSLSGARRCNGNVVEHTLLTLDADNDARLDDVDTAMLLGLDCAMVAHSTHSHESERPRLRYIAPLSRPCNNDEYQAVARKVAAHIGIETIDATCYDSCHAMFWPTCSRDATYYFREFKGPMLNPDEILAEYGPGDAWKDVGRWPISSRETEVVVREAKKQGDPEQKPGVVGKFCRAYDVLDAIDTFLSDIYEECETATGGKPRYTYKAGSSSGGAVVEDGGKFLYSHHATDPAGGQLLNAFDLVRIHLFGEQDDGQEAQEITRRPSYLAMCRFAVADARVLEQEHAERMAALDADFGDLAGAGESEDGNCEEAATTTVRPAEPAETETGTDATGWIRQLKVNHKTGEVDPTIDNAALILRNDPRLAGVIAVNKFTGRMVAKRKLPWRDRCLVAGEDMWTDADEANLLLYLEKYWHLSAEGKARLALAVAAEENAFHPVVEYLNGLKWDGVERLDTMLVRWMGAPDTPYVRAVTRKWMTAGVARMYEPGRKFDQMLMLVGPQGIGKSRLAFALAKGRWFTDSLGSTDGKEAYEGLRGKWICEFAELAATRKSEVESVKNFITKQEDSYRPAYGRNVVTFPRQAIFYGTTNDFEFLRDRTGNRRFWPVEIRGIDRGVLAGLDAEVDHLWAEAKERYKAGESLWLDDEGLAEMAREQQDRYVEQDELVGMIEEYLDRLVPNNWESMTKEEHRDYIQDGTTALAEGTHPREVICLMEIRYELMGQDISAVAKNSADTRRLATIMNNMPGWERTETRLTFPGYGRQRGYRRVGTAGRTEEERNFDRRVREAAERMKGLLD